MILEIKAKNFHSIGDCINVSFTVDGNAPRNHLYSEVGVVGFLERVSLVNSIIGPNASGKSNILNIISVLKHLIVDSQSDNSEIGLYYFLPHASHGDSENTELSVKFSVEDRLFEYFFTINNIRIISEKFSEYSKKNERFTAKTLFSKTWDSGKKSYIFETIIEDLKNFDIGDRENASVISVAKQIPKCKFAKTISDYWNKNVICKTDNSAYFDKLSFYHDFRNKNLDSIIDDPFIKNKTNELLKMFDVGYQDLFREEVKVNNNNFFSYGISHKYGKVAFNTPWGSESSGTKRLISILRDVVAALNTPNSTVVIDELDAFLHPDLSEAVVKLFQDESTNNNGTQVIFTTHNHKILAHLNKQQIFLTEKNEVGETDVWRLDDVKNVRADDNYYLKYISGAYSAKPRL